MKQTEAKTGVIDAVVFGITGYTGREFHKLLGPDRRFRTHGITHDISSDKAKALADIPGTTMYEADLNDKATIVLVLNNIKGQIPAGEPVRIKIFVVVDFWKGCGMKGSVQRQQYKNVADAVREFGAENVEIIVRVTLDDLNQYFPKGDSGLPLLEGGAIAPHFTFPALAREDYEGLPLVDIETTMFPNNVRFGLHPYPSADGFSLYLPIRPEAKIAVVDPSTTARVAHTIMLDGTGKFVGATITVVDEFISCAEKVEVLSDVFNVKVTFVRSDEAEARKVMGNEMVNMVRAYDLAEVPFCERRNLDETRLLSGRTWSYRESVVANRAEFETVLKPKEEVKEETLAAPPAAAPETEIKEEVSAQPTAEASEKAPAEEVPTEKALGAVAQQ